MQPKGFLALTLAGIPFALVVRQLATIESAFASIDSALANLDTAINAITRTDPTAETALADGTATVNGATAVDDNDAITLATDANNLTTEVTTVVDDLVAKQDVITAAGAVGETCSDLEAQETATQTFGDAVTAKVPTDLQSIAATLVA